MSRVCWKSKEGSGRKRTFEILRQSDLHGGEWEEGKRKREKGKRRAIDEMKQGMKKRQNGYPGTLNREPLANAVISCAGLGG